MTGAVAATAKNSSGRAEPPAITGFVVDVLAGWMSGWPCYDEP
ncbi:hypothetical protein AB0B45_40645 [Nonomuraea sp. NPDC049152]